MAYSSSLTDNEWELLEPLLSEVLPPKKQTRPPAWTKRELLDGVFDRGISDMSKRSPVFLKTSFILYCRTGRRFLCVLAFNNLLPFHYLR